MTTGTGSVFSFTTLTVAPTPVWASVACTETLTVAVASHGEGVRQVSPTARLRVTIASQGTSAVPAEQATLTLTPATPVTLTLDGV